MSRVDVNDMANEIIKGLEEYALLATVELKEAVAKAGKTVRKEIKENAPTNTGKYAKSWKVKKESETSNTLRVVVHSKDRYQLAHLLEFGHAKRNGGRVSARVHIAPAEELGEKQLEKDIEKALKGLV